MFVRSTSKFLHVHYCLYHHMFGDGDARNALGAELGENGGGGII